MASYARFRSRVIKPEVRSPIYVDYSVGGTDTQTGDFLVEHSSDGISDYVTPNYSRLIHQGSIVNNPCVYTLVEKSNESYPGTGSFQYIGPNSLKPRYTLTGPLTEYRMQSGTTGDEYYLSVQPDMGKVEDRCKLVALANVDSTPYAFGEDIGELRETLRFLVRPYESLLKISTAFRRYKKRRIDAGAKVTKATAEAYLAFQFGLSPLIRSLMDLCEAYNTRGKSYPPRLTARGFDRTDSSFTRAVNRNSGTMVFESSQTYSIEGHASILYEVSNPLRDWRFHLGLRAKDLPSTFWQLVPLSFMVDRLVDVNSSIRALTNLADPNVKILAGSYRYKLDEQKSIRLISQTNAPNWSISVSGNKAKEKSFTYNRQPWSPSVSDAIPGFTPSVLFDSASKISDLGALIIANLR